jgi:hypothetical protein
MNRTERAAGQRRVVAVTAAIAGVGVTGAVGLAVVAAHGSADASTTASGTATDGSSSSADGSSSNAWQPSGATVGQGSASGGSHASSGGS